ncbi:hypothetical protein DK842_00035 [Chromobacterium phragmitis]|uniref:hypothetical protein n=2 Tax=Chromobacterium phragmitis TaxID=2202141 RepID=UPI000DEC476E|nr:hypothetical protein [Chromobacterium phragmitis]AXE28459.1 hypothetical protein DK842_00035 [Chromobacterium phragmitis]
MSRVLPGNLVIEVQWEGLLGLSKEADEIRELAGRRGAKHFLALQNALGTRVVGLASLPGNVRKSEFFALAGLLREITDDQNVVFLHGDPADNSKVVFLSIHDGKPEDDRVLPRSAAIDAAIQFIQEVGAGVTILGDIDDERIQVTRYVNLADITTTLTDEEKRDYKFKQLPSRSWFGIALLFAVMGGTLGGVWWWSDASEKEAQARIAEAEAAKPDPVVEYRAQLKKALDQEPLNHGVQYARSVQRLIQVLPSEAGGWKVDRLLCKDQACILVWKRGAGGTFETLLKERQVSQFQDMDTASESLTIPESQARQVVPIPQDQFYLKGGVRMQILVDAGKQIEQGKEMMSVSLSKLQPLIAEPPALKNRRGAIELVSKGDWSLKGHLAFIDSIAGLLERAGNMSLTEVTVVINEKSPEFSAQGRFYVK